MKKFEKKLAEDRQELERQIKEGNLSGVESLRMNILLVLKETENRIHSERIKKGIRSKKEEERERLLKLIDLGVIGNKCEDDTFKLPINEEEEITKEKIIRDIERVRKYILGIQEEGKMKYTAYSWLRGIRDDIKRL